MDNGNKGSSAKYGKAFKVMLEISAVSVMKIKKNTRVKQFKLCSKQGIKYKLKK